MPFKFDCLTLLRVASDTFGSLAYLAAISVDTVDVVDAVDTVDMASESGAVCTRRDLLLR